MIVTEQNQKKDAFDSTQTFSVESHTAESLKKRINQANEQSLTVKNRAAQPPRPTRTPQGAANPAANGTNRPLRPAQNPQKPRPTAQNPRPAAQNVQNPRPAVHNGQNVRPAVSNGQAPRPAAQNPQAPRPAVSNGQAPRPTQSPQTPRPAVQNGQSPRPAVQGQPRPTAQAMPKKPQPQPVTESRSAARAKNSGLMEKLSRTRTTDLSISRSLFALNRKEEERYESGEGGNTVISVVKAIIYIIFVLVISVFLALGIIVIGNDVFAFVKSDEIVEVTIPEYATLDDVAQILYQNDIIRYPQVFKLYAVAENDDQKYLAGTYSVNGMMNYDTLLDTFKEKKPTGTIKITIPEGYTTDEIIDLFVSKGMGTREGFVEVIQNYDYDYWFIDLLEAEGGMSEDRFYRLDGYLFPDTYEFYLSSPERDIIGKLLKRFAQIFNKEYRAQCETMGYTVDEIITLASIIEKEAASPAEFFNVSSVFHNRLDQPWNYPHLESDATIVYAIQHETGDRVVLKNTTYETPYNTYLHSGLPPGPIANPSASAMLAALQPTDTEYFFFIADGGKTYFSKTRNEHDAYVAQFRDN